MSEKTVLVTGAAKRLGRAIALELAGAGWNIALHYSTSRDDAGTVANDIRAKGVKCAALAADFAKEAETETLIERANAELGPLTALINSASLFENDDWRTTNRKSWDAHMEINLRAPFLLCQHFARQLPKGTKGAIVNIVDQRVLKPTPQFISYSLSKAGLYWLTTTLAQALGPDIRVNAVGPGPTMRNPRQSEADFSRQRDATILKHGAEPEDIARAVCYLLGADAVTGQMLAVDGGQHLIWQTPDVQGPE
ncbi:MAG TPA: SDR family oxidoreductase [Rhizomicrobium sp.]|nr:SDR family oxidoreductase [Rhizomicrobium sp.]